MTIIEIIILGLALSMDAFAVTICNLMSYPKLSRARCLALPITFGVFQGLMVLIGYLAGSLATGYIDAYAGPIALIILTVIGGRMIYEAVKDMRTQQKRTENKAAPATAVIAEISGSTETIEAEGVTAAIAESAATESATDTACSTATSSKTLSIPAILIQGVATSIDALVVGISLVALGTNIFLATPVVALTTFLVCLAGLAIGRRFGILLGERAQIIGGIILILIGIKACFF